MLIGSYGNSSVQITSIFYFLSDLTFYSVVYLVFGLLFAERLKKEETLHLQNISFFLYAFLIEISVIILNAVVVYHSREAFDQVYYVIFMVFMAFGCITSLVLQFNMLRNEQLRDEILLFSYLLGEKEKQYLASKESVDIINQKCHDLKHMVKSWRHGRGIDDQELKDIEKAISIYDSVVKTGNETLDVILTEKSLICSHYGIRLTCLAEAERLNFIRDTDLYILFGNILDNAIEAVRKIEIPEKRVIALNIKRVNEMLVVNVRNYYEGKIIMEGGLPVTGKEDTNFHGFGMKSIRRIVEQYDGSLSLDTDNGLFKVNILFPSM
ncbi:MAG: sensor histidine kinase [Lachnospiraceae bacterium]|nr:sensor histidine kinase [Lachnospiraceae bacterium]